jgi:hypothetical protein
MFACTTIGCCCCCPAIAARNDIHSACYPALCMQHHFHLMPATRQGPGLVSDYSHYGRQGLSTFDLTSWFTAATMLYTNLVYLRCFTPT